MTYRTPTETGRHDHTRIAVPPSRLALAWGQDVEEWDLIGPPVRPGEELILTRPGPDTDIWRVRRVDADGQIYEASDEEDPFCTTDHLEGIMVHPVEAGPQRSMCPQP